MLRKQLSVLLAGLLLVSSLAGCGTGGSSSGSGDSQTETSDPPSSTAESAPASTEGGAEISMYTWWAEGEQDLGEAIIADFEANHADIKVNANFIPYNDYLSKLNTMIAAKETPDVFMINEFLCNEWGEMGVGMNLLDMYNQRGLDINELYLPTAMFRTGEDNLWGLSWSLVCMVLYYNKDMLAEAGIEPPSLSATEPWTWEQYVDAARKLTKDSAGNSPGDADFNFDNAQVFGTLMPGVQNFMGLMSMLYTGGVTIASDDGKTLAMTGPEGAEIIQKLADLSLVEQAAPGLSVQRGTFSNPSVMLMNGQLGMFVDGSYIYPNFANEDYDVGVAQIPMFKEPGNMVFGASYMIGAETKNPDAAFDFFQYIVDFDKYVDASANNGVGMAILPSTYATMNDQALSDKWTALYDEDMATLTIDILNNASRLAESATVKNWSVIMDQTITPALDRVYLGEATAADVCAELDTQLAAEMQGVWGD